MPRPGTGPIRIILFANARPRLAWRLALRLEQEAPGTRICGLVHRAPCAPGPNRGRIRAAARHAADAALRWIHASPRNPDGHGAFTDEDLILRCRAAGWPILVADEPGSRPAIDFVRDQDPDLGVLLGGGVFPEDMLLVPRRGSIAARTSQGLTLGSPSGRPADRLPKDVKIEVVRVEQGREPSAVLHSRALGLEPYETRTSRLLKEGLLTNDLLVRAVTDLVAGGEAANTAGALLPTDPSSPVRVSPSPENDGPRRPPRPVKASRPLWKMCLYAAALSPYVVARNWYRRRRGRCPVIILFHHLAADRPHHLGMPTHEFFRTVRFLQRHYRVVSLREAMESLASGSVSAPTVALTLDDGYRENFLTVRAVMEETGVPLTMFVNPDLIEREAPFPHDWRSEQSQFLPLTWDQLAYFARNGVEIGSHTRSHFDCGSRDRTALEGEIVGSRQDLERRLGRPVRFFAFPWGQPPNMSPEAVEIARGTYQQVFAAHGGENMPGRAGPSGILMRRFQCPSLWELELSLQSVFDLAISLRRALAPRPRARGGTAKPRSPGDDYGEGIGAES